MYNARKAEKTKIEDFLAMPKVTVEQLIYNPIQCGYFLKFCKQEYSEENLEFVMAVQKFSDNLTTRDKNGWPAGKTMDDGLSIPLTGKHPNQTAKININIGPNQKAGIADSRTEIMVTSKSCQWPALRAA